MFVGGSLGGNYGVRTSLGWVGEQRICESLNNL